MSEAPKEVWCKPYLGYDYVEDWLDGSWSIRTNYGGIRYVRADRIEELEEKLAKAVSRLDKLPYWLEEKLAKAVSRLDKLTYWLDIDQELWDAFTVMEKSDHRHMQSEVQAIKDILTGGKDD